MRVEHSFAEYIFLGTGLRLFVTSATRPLCSELQPSWSCSVRRRPPASQPPSPSGSTFLFTVTAVLAVAVAEPHLGL